MREKKFDMHLRIEELFGRVTKEKAEEIILFLHREDPMGYRRMMGMLAQRRKLRPIFIERKPKVERHAWMMEELRRRRNADLALEALQAWILKDRSGMVLDFLEILGITHDGKGLVDELPEEPDGKKVEEAVEKLLAKYEAEDVALYLNLFLCGGEGKWVNLERIVEKDSRLSLSRGVISGGEKVEDVEVGGGHERGVDGDGGSKDGLEIAKGAGDQGEAGGGCGREETIINEKDK
ncbi:MAG: hypothetical protein N2035_02905 [Chthoniobacterales bacterium]|nr:hypothetical protein [Chthoniobacterales bacterium]